MLRCGDGMAMLRMPTTALVTSRSATSEPMVPDVVTTPGRLGVPLPPPGFGKALGEGGCYCLKFFPYLHGTFTNTPPNRTQATSGFEHLEPSAGRYQVGGHVIKDHWVPRALPGTTVDSVLPF